MQAGTGPAGAGRGQNISQCWVDEVLQPRELLLPPIQLLPALFCAGIEPPLSPPPEQPTCTVMRAVLDKQEWACPHPDANTDSKHWIWCQLGFMHRLGKAQTPNPASLSRLDPDCVGLALVLVTWHKQINSEPQIKNSLLLQVLSSAKPFQTHMVLNTLKLKHFQTDTKGK